MDEIQPWIERLFRKIENNPGDIIKVEEDGLEDARIVVVAYGSTARSARHAINIARGRYGRKVGLLRLKTLWPFPEAAVERACENAQRVIVPEMNLGQIALEVERMVGYKKVTRVGRADGHMVAPEQILDAIRSAPTRDPLRSLLGHAVKAEEA
jgi:2-oxoglutarate ferredoxin oxidoreductase subunit alpha